MKKLTHRFALAVLATTLVVAAGVTQATAMQERPGAEDDVNGQILANFNEFLNAHPWIANKLRENPTLVNNNDFLRDNHELRDWLGGHPEAREEFRADPRGFMRREREFQLHGRVPLPPPGDAYRNELGAFAAFLRHHPEIREDLYSHPDRVRRPEYLEHHPQLRGFLENHPALRERLENHPRAFIDEVRDFDRR